jgi:hypothetical protein
MEVKDIIPNLNRPVVYNGSIYTLTGSIIRKDSQGKLYYQAEILDKNKNSICIVRLEDISWQE